MIDVKRLRKEIIQRKLQDVLSKLSESCLNDTINEAQSW